MFIFYYTILFIFGGTLGSFALVIVDRYNTSFSWWKGRSKCLNCNSFLKVLDLMPFFSFLFLKGRCRYCNLKIPFNLFFAEIVMGILSVFASFRSGLVSDFSYEKFAQYLVLTAIFGLILIISLYDIKHFIIPNSFLVILLFLSSVYNKDLLIPNFISGILLTTPFLLLFFFSRGKWLGFGDIKYMFVIGVLLGLPIGLTAIVFAFWIGAFYSIIALLVFNKNLTMKSMIPFGPFLSIGIILAFLFQYDLFKINDLIYFFKF